MEFYFKIGVKEGYFGEENFMSWIVDLKIGVKCSWKGIGEI